MNYETQTYTWEHNDRIGQGAFGSVFKARHKLNGEIVAVKVLNIPNNRNQAFMDRAMEMQNREIDIMKRYSHKNIVKLLNVEKLKQGNKLTLTVIVMELCTGGNLYDILQEPQNSKGLEETQFCQVLFDLASAMEYLRENNIVHRDIKPLNIMCHIDDNEKLTYKLIDFGASRHLPENLNFTSIVGTEEYLHPDIYKRGVLRDMNAPTDFDECVDLWSVGVTLYHAAVGDLPFKPFAGVRVDHQTMNKMISEKPLGSISATQKYQNGPIEWSSVLPDECKLSRGLQNLLLPLLINLLSSKDEGISFEKFFEITKDIKQKIVFFVFDTTSSQIQRIYVNPNHSLEEVKKQIALLTETSTANQILLFENLEFESMCENNADENFKIAKNFPRTWLDNPIYMFWSAIKSTIQIPPLYQISFESSNQNFNYLLQIHLQELYCKQHTLSNVILFQKLLIRAAKMYQLWFDRKVSEIKDDIVRLDSLLQETGKRIELLIVYCVHIQKILPSGNNIRGSLNIKDANRNLESYKRQAKDLKSLKLRMEDVCKSISENPIYWINQTFCNEKDACQERITNSLVKVGKMQNTVEKWIKLEKLEMERISDKAFAYINEHCIPRLQNLFTEFTSWYNKMLCLKNEYYDCLIELEKIEFRHSQLTNVINKNQDGHKNSLTPDIFNDNDFSMDNISITEQQSIQPLPGIQTTPDLNFVVHRRNRLRIRNELQLLGESLSASNLLQADIIRGLEENDRLLENLGNMTSNVESTT